jgi:hypothetical protein
MKFDAGISYVIDSKGGIYDSTRFPEEAVKDAQESADTCGETLYLVKVLKVIQPQVQAEEFSHDAPATLRPDYRRASNIIEMCVNMAQEVREQAI